MTEEEREIAALRESLDRLVTERDRFRIERDGAIADRIVLVDENEKLRAALEECKQALQTKLIAARDAVR
jgi:hypothetical protein